MDHVNNIVQKVENFVDNRIDDVQDFTDWVKCKAIGVLRSGYNKHDIKASSVLPSSREFKLPTSVDCRPHVTNPKQQGEIPSCVGMVGARIAEWHQYIKTGEIVEMSPECIYEQRNDIKSPGMTGRNCMGILTTFGCITKEEYNNKTIYNNKKQLPKLAIKRRIGSSARIFDAHTLKKALVVNGPCLVVLPLLNSTRHFWCPVTQEEQLNWEKEGKIKGHGVACIGYRDECDVDPGEEAGFIICNSWGASWGDNGYTILPYDHFDYVWESWTALPRNDNDKNKNNKALRKQGNYKAGGSVSVSNEKHVEEDDSKEHPRCCIVQ